MTSTEELVLKLFWIGLWTVFLIPGAITIVACLKSRDRQGLLFSLLLTAAPLFWLLENLMPSPPSWLHTAGTHAAAGVALLWLNACLGRGSANAWGNGTSAPERGLNPKGRAL